MNSVRPNNLSLKYQRFVPSGCKDIELENLSLCQSVKIMGYIFYLTFKIVSVN